MNILQNNRSYILVLFAALVVLTSCTATLKNHWRDFTAFYNTYYNAQRSFQTGIEKVREQSVSINPEQPIRIHPAPVSAGQQDFEKAITKGAKILRKYSKSRWVDDALRLIGKSYYYKQEYFSAEQKFRELYANAKKPSMKQQAVYWRGRVFMEMELYSQGINYLLNELKNIKNWKPRLRAESQSVVAELYSELGRWKSANQYLVKSIPDLRNDKHKARAYFLHGQVLERLGRLEEAFGAYKKVPGLHPAYDLIYHARRKQAEVSREAGKLERAYRIFVEMSKDDKNFEILPELKYEIARTLQAMGNVDKAIDIYNWVLHNKNQQPTSSTRAKAYYGLANLYRNQFNNFRKAAAYYDSAASVNVDIKKMPQDYRASQLSKSFGEYASLKNQMHKADSLLWLGGLPKAKFDSVLAEIKKRRKKKMEERRKDRRRKANTVVSPEKAYENQKGKRKADNPSSGFLNYQNKRLVAESRQAFEAYWGNRPLVDHWRRQEMIRQLKESSDTSVAGQGKKTVASNRELRNLDIDLEDIPVSEEARRQKKREILKARYELANTFFLSLNMPDSARNNYWRIIKKAPDTSSIVPKALYSLSELNFIEQDSIQARKLARRLVNEYPETEYARRVADRFNLTLSDKYLKPEKSLSDSVYVAYRSLNDSLTRLHSLARARAYSNFARKYPEAQAAPYALYKSAKQYLRVARLSASKRKRYPSEQLKNVFSATASSRKALASLKAGVSSMGGVDYPCTGKYWDSVRTTVNRIQQNYNNITIQTQLTPSPERDTLYSCKDVHLQAQMSGELQRYVERLKKSTPEQNELDRTGRLFVELRENLTQTLTEWKAEKKREFALSHTQSRLAPFALYDAAKLYMQLGRRDTTFSQRADKWFKIKQRMEKTREAIQQKMDSLQVLLKDTKAQNAPAAANQRDNGEAGKPQKNQKRPPESPSKRTRPGNRKPDNEADPQKPQQEVSRQNDQNKNPDLKADNKAASDTTENDLSEKERKELRNQLKALQDSSVKEPDYEKVFPYIGPYWDSTRVVLNQFTANFQGKILRNEVRNLKDELAIPEELKKQKQDSVRKDSVQQQIADSLNKTRPDTVGKMAADTLNKQEKPSIASNKQKEPPRDSKSERRAPPDSLLSSKKDTSAPKIPPGGKPKDSVSKSDLMDENRAKATVSKSAKAGNKGKANKKKKIPTCVELNVTPEIVGGMDAFTKKIEYPKKVRRMSMDGQATFEVIFDKGGRVNEVSKQGMGTLGIQDSIKAAIEDHMTIKPILKDNKPVRVKCKITVPVHIEPRKKQDSVKKDSLQND